MKAVVFTVLTRLVYRTSCLQLRTHQAYQSVVQVRRVRYCTGGEHFYFLFQYFCTLVITDCIPLTVVQ